MTLYHVVNRQVGAIRSTVHTETADASIRLTGNDTVLLNKADGDIAITIVTAPQVGDTLEISCLAVDTGHTVTLPTGVTWDGTNDVATFDAADETIICRAISATRWLVLSNAASVAFN